MRILIQNHAKNDAEAKHQTLVTIFGIGTLKVKDRTFSMLHPTLAWQCGLPVSASLRNDSMRSNGLRRSQKTLAALLVTKNFDT
jgi:hypothetical protein